MTNPRSVVLWAAVLVLAVAGLVVAGCGGDKSNPMTPTKELDSGIISPGGMYAHTFSTAGTYHYCCDVHGCGVMSGDVTVGAGSPMAAAVNITNFAFTPGNATVAPGGTVTWTNNGSNHTVTSH